MQRPYFDPNFEDDGDSFSVRRQRELDRRYGKKEPKLLVAQQYFQFALSALSVPFTLFVGGVALLIWFFATGR